MPTTFVRALIFVKLLAQLFSHLLGDSLLSEEVNVGGNHGRPDLMFRTMWFMGSLFLNSMFLLHVFYEKEFALAVTTWLRHEQLVICKFLHYF